MYFWADRLAGIPFTPVLQIFSEKHKLLQLTPSLKMLQCYPYNAELEGKGMW